ncbi:MAG: hypothetical protein KGL39_37375 [Patescibacteria group bacterium]|nr:hypothetical protein [Patescibacteria group bacterium]
MRRHNEVDGYQGPESEEVNDYLRERHGESYVGFPLWRLVYSAHVLKWSGGEWSDWDENIPVLERGAVDYEVIGHQVGVGQKDPKVAERRVIELRRTPMYPELHNIPGWILERWMGPAYLGSPTEWLSRKVAGSDVPQMGPYPHNGLYVHMAGPFPEAPTGPFLDQWVEQWEMMRDDTLAYAADAYVRKRWYEAEQEELTRNEKWNREASQANMTAMQVLFGTYLEGGIARQAAVERAGIQSNYGN